MPRAKKQPVASLPVPQVEATAPAQPAAPSPAVLALQQQVVELVAQRSAGRAKLTESHAVYLMAQSKFQAAQAELQGIEQEVQYRIGLIGQLENRQSAMQPGPSLVPTMQGISSEPTPQRFDPGDMVSRGHATREGFGAM